MPTCFITRTTQCPSNCPLPRFPMMAAIPESVGHHGESCRANFHAPRDFRSNSHEHERLRLVHPLTKSVPVEYLSFCVRGKFSQMGPRRGLMVVKGTEELKIFLELGVFAMALENLPKSNDIYDGTFPNPVHEGCTRTFRTAPW
ncbi:hypothetical protein TNCV_3918601 [Trichonephila clavipes]|nr:hypothetical protein TNCV_3918601 [Trichonephila clavipes]